MDAMQRGTAEEELLFIHRYKSLWILKTTGLVPGFGWLWLWGHDASDTSTSRDSCLRKIAGGDFTTRYAAHHELLWILNNSNELWCYGLRSHGQLEPHCIRKKPRVSSPAEIAATVDSAWRLGMWRLNMVEHCYENMEWRGLRRMERRACVLMAAGTPTTLHLRDWNAVRKNTCQSWMLWEVLSEESCALLGVCAPFLKFEFQPSAPKR